MKKNLYGISMITLTCLYGILFAIVFLIVMLVGGDLLIAISVGILILLIQFLISPWITDLTMKFFYGAKMNYELPEVYVKFIEDICSKYGVKYPMIGFIDDGAPNIFTYGRTKADARIIITRGIFELLDENEVKSVIGHEMGHIVHLDMLFMTACQVVPLVLYAIYEAFADSSSSDNNSNKLAAVGYLAYILYIISQYIVLWLSRTREYYADDFSIDVTKNPNALASSLVKIGFGLSVNRSKDPKKRDVSKNNALGIFDTKASSSLSISAYDGKGISKDKIKNAMKWEMWNPWAKWFEIHSTHPLISKRLLTISKRSNEFNQEPYIVFDLVKPESYVDDFIAELFICFLPSIFLIAFMITVVFGVLSTNFKFAGISLLLFTIFSFIKYKRAHKKPFVKTNVESLLGEIKVSNITSVPCILKGTIIGRGNPGCIFNEDFVIKDETGIIFLDYNQPLKIVNKLFALFKSKEYFDKEVEVRGWYRRSPVPYVEILEYTVDGKTKVLYTYFFSMAIYVVLLILSIFLFVI